MDGVRSIEPEPRAVQKIWKYRGLWLHARRLTLLFDGAVTRFRSLGRVANAAAEAAPHPRSALFCFADRSGGGSACLPRPIMRLHDDRVAQHGSAGHGYYLRDRRTAGLVRIPGAQADVQQIGNLVVGKTDTLLPATGIIPAEFFLFGGEHQQVRRVDRKLAYIPQHRGSIIADRGPPEDISSRQRRQRIPTRRDPACQIHLVRRGPAAPLHAKRAGGNYRDLVDPWRFAGHLPRWEC